MSGFVHLHLHTEYSLLDGATRISKIADKAISDGQTAVAITDHGVMYGAVEFYEEMKKKGVKPIIGCEVYVARRSRFDKEGRQDSSGDHLVLLCKDAIGYKNLCYMVSESFINGFYSKPRIDMELLRTHAEGLIALSGCIGGQIPQLILAGAMAEAEEKALEFKRIFGEDFYLEVQNHGIEEERRAAYGIKLLSAKLGIPMVATNDVHYLEKKDADTQAILMCVQTGNCILDGRPISFETDEFYFKTAEEMEALFASFPGAVENTVKIAEKCNFDFEFNNLHLPTFTPEDGLTHRDKLRKDAYEGFEKRIKDGRFDFDRYPKQEYLSRLEYELSVIDKMGFNAYFLIVADFVGYAKRMDIPVGPGRGSGTGSLVAFCIGITDLDPIAFDLLFERFLNPERVSMPDFDIDFCYNRREEVINYVKEKYGEDKVAQIVTFGTLAPRAAVRDVGRALGISYGKVDTIAKMIPRDCVTLEDALSGGELRKSYLEDDEVRKLLDISRDVEGMPRHASTHAAGVVITEKPTYEYVPLSNSGTGVVVQYDMITAAKLGLVKFDFLGLRYITVIHDAEKMIREREKDFNISTVPFDDKKTFKLLCDARSDGVFQLESGGMKNVLTRLQPSTLEDIIACVALFRPGPMDSIDKFIARKHGRERVEYSFEALKDILDVTYGCIVYQEQVMQICRTLAGYSYARADIVRRAMSKKNGAEMEKERTAFLDGCLERGVPSEVAEDIFDEMVGFAKYAFNKSHAAVYSVTSYRTAYLKTHYPTEYFAALLSSVLSNNSDLKKYIADAAKFGVKVLSPDINSSGSDFTVSDGNIRFGLMAVRGVGKQFADAVIRIRQDKPFSSFDDFVERMPNGEINKRTVESLIKCGAFDSLGVPRSALMECYENIVDSKQEKHRSNVTGQMDMFSLMMGGAQSSADSGYKYPDIPEYPLKELLILEKESSGIYFSGHMIDNYSMYTESLAVDKIGEILEDADPEQEHENQRYKDKSKLKIAGIITQKKTKVTKNGSTMAFLTVEDKYGEIEVIVFAKQYAAYSSLLFQDNAVFIEGNLSVEEDRLSVMLSTAAPLVSNTDYSLRLKEKNKTVEQEAEKPKRIYIKVDSLSDNRISLIYRLAALNRGSTQIVLFDNRTGKYSVMKDVSINPRDNVFSRLYELFGKENTVYK